MAASYIRECICARAETGGGGGREMSQVHYPHFRHAPIFQIIIMQERRRLPLPLHLCNFKPDVKFLAKTAHLFWQRTIC